MDFILYLACCTHIRCIAALPSGIETPVSVRKVDLGLVRSQYHNLPKPTVYNIVTRESLLLIKFNPTIGPGIEVVMGIPMQAAGQPSVAELDICTMAKRLGYAASQSVRLYGEEYEAVSDPFLHGGVVALHVRTRRDSRIRTVRLPSTILRSAVGHRNAEMEVPAVMRLGRMLFDEWGKEE